MTAEIKTVVGHLYLVNGAWRSEAPNQVAVREPQAANVPGAGKGDLFILTEVRGPVSKPDLLEQQLAQTIRDAYYLARGSVTTSLRRALQAANEQLYQHNRKADPGKKIIAGAAVLVVQDEEAFFAQVGPAAVFAVLSDLMRRYPAQSAWLDRKPVTKESALGSESLVEPNLHHLYLTPGDMLILSDSRLAGQISLDNVVKSVNINSLKATLKNLGEAVQLVDCSALILATTEADGSPLAALKKTTPSKLAKFLNREPNPKPGPGLKVKSSPILDAVAEPEPALAGVTDQAAGPVPAKLPLWAGRFTKPHPPQKPAGDEARPHQQAVTVTEADEPVPSQFDYSFRPNEPLKEEPQARARVMHSVAHDPDFQARSQRGRPPTGSFSAGTLVRWIGAGLLLLLAMLGNGLKTIFGLVLPNSGNHAPRQAGTHAYYQHQTSPVPGKLMRNIVIAIPVIVGLIVAVSYIQKGRILEAEYQAFLTNAQSKFQQAQGAAADPAAALGLMAEAEAALVEAETMKGPQPEITQLRQQMAEAADQIGKVERLFYLPQLRQYPDAGTNLKRVVVQGVEIFVLDAGADRIFYHKLDDLGETLLPDDGSTIIAAKQQAIENITVGDLLGMTWMPVGGNRQTSDLIILNSTGLLEYNPNWGITTSTLAGSELLTLPAAVSSYFGNFYILDPQANRLLRYLPTADGYNATPESYFPEDQAVDLTNAVDLAIDGAIYILFADGRISKYEAGQPVEFSLTGLDRPLNNPVAIFTAPDEEVQYLYVADAGQQRIVQLEKNGRFVRQFKPSADQGTTFSNLQDVFVDEIGGRMYILDSNNLYMTTLPEETAGE